MELPEKRREWLYSISVASIVSGEIGFWQYLANLVADKFASDGARNLQVHEDIANEIKALYGKTSSVRRRLIAVHEIRFGTKQEAISFIQTLTFSLKGPISGQYWLSMIRLVMTLIAAFRIC